MADNNSSPAKRTGSVANCVREPPARNGVGVGDISCLPLIDVPVIDLYLLAPPSSCTQELEKLRSALSSFGCFLSINHGMTSSFLDQVRSVIKQFFALPTEEKQKYAVGVDSKDGYDKLDTLISEDQLVLDWIERLVLEPSVEDQRPINIWPQNPANFRAITSEYTTKLQKVTEVVFKAMARSLNLEEHCFLDKYGDQPRIRARFNYYPPCSRNNLVVGLKPHTDPTAITVVLQDREVEGLQFLKNDQWFRVPIIPEALLINIGDQVEIMSNGLFKTLVHRVVKDPERERISVAVNFFPDPDKDLEPVDGLVNETRPIRYKKVENYLDTFVHYLQQKKSLIEALKI
ncbi:2-oxoglutarate-dependent dioxygenase 11-like [Mercurialis annua]|uniref:2-oxoglutarate-dependent dioxygenase 11-like n=1 Tax=Mercurialis annua TaxID=3986 RepID=UPI00215FDEDE|nr:2-oxoglutarate-dependent dioxygenase 11-like [Mercurialis annua]